MLRLIALLLSVILHARRTIAEYTYTYEHRHNSLLSNTTIKTTDSVPMVAIKRRIKIMNALEHANYIFHINNRLDKFSVLEIGIREKKKKYLNETSRKISNKCHHFGDN